MGNLLPTLTIVMTEIAVLLLIVVGYLWSRLRRLRRLHQAEIDTLMGLASQARTLPISLPVRSANNPADSPATPDQPAVRTRPPEPEAAAAPAREPLANKQDDDGLAGHIDEALSDIRRTMEQMDIRLDQFRHEHTLLAGRFRKLIEEGNNEVHYTRRDLDRIYQVVRELRKQLGDLSGNTPHPGLAPAPQPQPPLRESARRTAPAITSVTASAAIRQPQPPQADRTPAQRQPAATAPAEDPGLLLDLEGIAVEEINISDLDVENPHGLKDERAHPSHFDEDRIFFQSSVEDGLEQGWYFNGYGDQPQGPFADHAAARRVMKEMHEQSTRNPVSADLRTAGKV